MSAYASLRKAGFSADGSCAYLTFALVDGSEDSLCLLSERYASLVRGKSEFNNEEYADIVFESEYSRAVITGMRSLACAPCTKKEMYLKLRKKKFSPDACSLAADYFCENGYINEKEHMICEIKNCIAKKYGPIKIRSRLVSKGFPQALIEKGMRKLEEYDFTSGCRYLATKRGLGDPFDMKEKNAMYAYLVRNGYTSECIKSVLSVLYADVE